MDVFKRMEDELTAYRDGYVDLSDDVQYSDYKTKQRISLFENRHYPTGKLDELGRYRYWYDISGPRVNDEVKNLRIDTDQFTCMSRAPRADYAALTLINASKDEYMEVNGYAEELKEDVQKFSGWGNIVWKRVGNKWQRLNLLNVYLTNVTARTLEQTDVIERMQLTARQLRSKEAHGWENIDTVLEHLGERQFQSTDMAAQEETTAKFYEVFERVGELTEREWNQINGKKDGDDNKTILCKVIVAGLKQGVKDHKYVLFKEKIKDMKEVYQEAHRGAYRGRWLREGMYELLFDHQVRANEIGNQIAKGLEWASLTVFRSQDNQTFNNVLSDMEDGQIIRSADFAQVPIRMQSLDQLIADWNRNIQEADRIANSYEIVRGEEMKSNTPFRLARELNQNANKLFVFLRQQFAFGYRRIMLDWVLPELVQDLRYRDVIQLTGDDAFMRKIHRMVASHWFNNNLAKIGPMAGDPEYRKQLIELKMAEFAETELTVKVFDKDIWKGLQRRLYITITGENDATDEELEDIANFIQIEQRPKVREYLLERAYSLRGIDIPEEALEPDEQQTIQNQTVQQAA